mgnify:CR=1 FL=1
MIDIIVFFSSRGNQAKNVALKVLDHIGLPLDNLIDVSLVDCAHNLDFNHAILLCCTSRGCKPLQKRF